VPRDLELTAADGRRLAATLYAPAEPAPASAGLLVAGATGVARRFYDRLATDLTGRGLLVLTLDYRGLAGSRDRPLRGDPARLEEWGALDLAAGIESLSTTLDGRPLGVLGHSAGGWLLGLADNASRVDAMVTVASQVGDWRAWPAPRKYLLWLFWHVVLPGAVGIWGYLPKFILGGEDLPAGVARQWAAWGKRESFLAGTAAHRSAKGYAAVSCPLRAYAIEDDLYAPPTAVARFPTLYPNAASEVRLIGRSGTGPLVRVGEPAAGPTPLPQRPDHFGVFRPAFRDTLWHEWASWLSERLVRPAAPAVAARDSVGP
jgi:predicted alpha/beta hydrolase